MDPIAMNSIGLIWQNKSTVITYLCPLLWMHTMNHQIICSCYCWLIVIISLAVKTRMVCE